MSDPVSTETPSQPLPQPQEAFKRRKIAVPVVVAILLVTAGGAAYLYHHGDAKSEYSASAAAKPAPRPATYTLPATIDGLPKSTDQQITSLSTAAVTDLGASMGDLNGDPVVGTYASQAPDAAILVGLPAISADSDTEIANVFDALRSTQFFNIPDPAAVATGQPGSSMQCSDASLIGGVAIAVGACVESDAGGSVLLLRLTKTGAQTADILKATLPTFEKR